MDHSITFAWRVEFANLAKVAYQAIATLLSWFMGPFFSSGCSLQKNLSKVGQKFGVILLNHGR